jgi:hypothetical protein
MAMSSSFVNVLGSEFKRYLMVCCFVSLQSMRACRLTSEISVQALGYCARTSTAKSESGVRKQQGEVRIIALSTDLPMVNTRGRRGSQRQRG